VLAGVIRALCVDSEKVGSWLECRDGGWLGSRGVAQKGILVSVGDTEVCALSTVVGAFTMGAVALNLVKRAGGLLS
jgi:hypothetical protein